MSTRALALLCRYAAAVIAGEPLAYLTRRTLREDCGLTDDEIDIRVQAIRVALEQETT